MAKLENGLTVKQEEFALKFVECGVASEAYRHAYDAEGMTPEQVWTAACVLAKHQKVAKRVNELREAAAERAEVSIDRLVKELSLIAFANMQDYMTVTEDGAAYLDLSGLTRSQAAAISELTCETYDEGKGDGAKTVKRTRMKLSDKQAAIEKLGRHLGMFKDIAEISGPNGGPIQTQASIDPADKRDLARWIALKLTTATAGKGASEGGE